MVIDQSEYEESEKKKKYEIGGEQCQQVQVNQDLYGLVKSDTHYGAFYLITGKDKLSCSCPARADCKHLKEIKNGNRTCVRISRSSKE